jgi:hypothetical protein
MRKRTLILLLLLGGLLSSYSVYAQNTVKFTYDNCGNRIKRILQLRKVEENGKNVETKNGYVSSANDSIGAVMVSLFPNPTEGRVTVSFSDNANATIDAILTTIAGDIIERQRFVGCQHEFDLSSQPAGIYLLKLISGVETRTWKIVKR